MGKNGLTGIVNLGNTCFMNSAIQCLNSISPMTEYFVTNKYQEDIDTNRQESSMVKHYARLIKGMWDDTRDDPIEPKSFLRILAFFAQMFRGSQQHDSQECITFVLDIMHKALCQNVDINVSGNPTSEAQVMQLRSYEQLKKYLDATGYSIITELFYGQLVSRVQCNQCQNISHTFDPFCYLSVPVESELTLDACLHKFIDNELLSKGNEYDCEHCKNRNPATKQLMVWKAPEVLVIHLKRFNFRKIGERISKFKLNTNITFPLNNLDLSEYMSNMNTSNSTCRYNLVAVSNHSGNIDGGHYYSYVRRDDNWYDLNDTRVTQINQDEVHSPAAYVLFYSKMSFLGKSSGKNIQDL